MASAEPADAEPIVELTVPEPVSSSETHRSAEIAAAANGRHREDAVVALPTVTADDSGDVSAETAYATGDATGDLHAEVNGLPASLVFELSNTRQRYADALVDMAEHYLANGPGHRERRTGQRYEVVLTIGRNELAGQLDEQAAHATSSTRTGASTKRTPARSPATPTSRSSSRMLRATC